MYFWAILFDLNSATLKIVESLWNIFIGWYHKWTFSRFGFEKFLQLRSKKKLRKIIFASLLLDNIILPLEFRIWSNVDFMLCQRLLLFVWAPEVSLRFLFLQTQNINTKNLFLYTNYEKKLSNFHYSSFAELFCKAHLNRCF